MRKKTSRSGLSKRGAIRFGWRKRRALAIQAAIKRQAWLDTLVASTGEQA